MSSNNLKEFKEMFSDRLRDARQAKGLTQEELAKMLGVSNGAVGIWETGPSLPRTKTLDKIAALLDTDQAFLLYGKKETESRFELHEPSPRYHAVPDIGAMLDDLEAEFNERLKRIRKMLNYSTSRKPRTGSITSDVEKATREFLNAGKKG